jgi:hypothetical protein
MKMAMSSSYLLAVHPLPPLTPHLRSKSMTFACLVVDPLSAAAHPHEPTSPLLNGRLLDGDADDAPPLLVEGLVAGAGIVMSLLQSLRFKNGPVLRRLILRVRPIVPVL